LTSGAEKVLCEMTLGFVCSGQTCDIKCGRCPVKNKDQKKDMRHRSWKTCKLREGL